MKPKSKPRIAKSSPRQPGKGGRVMWASSPDRINSGQWFVVRPTKSELASWCLQSPVLVLDLSQEARERRVAIAKKAVETGPAFFTYEQVVRAVLASIGDTPANEGREK